jgi:hypothetical protein
MFVTYCPRRVWTAGSDIAMASTSKNRISPSKERNTILLNFLILLMFGYSPYNLTAGKEADKKTVNLCAF